MYKPQPNRIQGFENICDHKEIDVDLVQLMKGICYMINVFIFKYLMCPCLDYQWLFQIKTPKNKNKE